MTSISEDADSGQSFLPVDSAPGIKVPFLAFLDAECVLVVSASTEFVEAIRAQAGTKAVDHPTGTDLTPVYPLLVPTVPDADTGSVLLQFEEQPNTPRAITAVVTVGKKITVAGNRTAEFPAGATAVVDGSTGNDGSYEVASSTFATDHTDIVVVEVVLSAVADGTITGIGVHRVSAVVPAGAQITQVAVTVDVAFDADPSVDAGDTADPNGYIDGEQFLDVGVTQFGIGAELASPGVYMNDGAGFADPAAGYSTEPRTITAVMTTSGESGSAGRASLFFQWAKPTVHLATVD